MDGKSRTGIDRPDSHWMVFTCRVHDQNGKILIDKRLLDAGQPFKLLCQGSPVLQGIALNRVEIKRFVGAEMIELGVLERLHEADGY